MFRKYWTERKYVDGKPTDEYRGTDELYDGVVYISYEECMDIDRPVPPVDPNDYYNQYFTIDISYSSFVNISAGLSYDNLYYSVNYGKWTKFTKGGFNVETGDKVCFKNTSDEAYYHNRDGNSYPSNNSIFTNLPAKRIYGNLNSMYAGDNFKTDVRMYENMFKNWFYNCQNIVDASNLVLPATKLASYSYYHMFYYCTALVNAPELPATELADNCYSNMFQGCTALVTAPELPSTTLARYCYNSMFANCTALVNAPVLPATEVVYGCYMYMFSRCSSLVNAPVLPAKKTEGYCYNSMFANCTALVTAPELPATTLANSCYSYMFEGCSSLVTAPELPATTLANSCYRGMFEECKSLEKAPVLPARMFADYCYYSMFEDCEKLNYVKCLVEVFSYAAQPTDYWLRNVSYTGTFVKKKAFGWQSGRDGIPSNWTVEEVD